VVASRTRRDLLERREARLRELIAEAKSAPAADPARIRMLLDSLEQSIGEPSDVDLRDPEEHVTS
jgi:hypothetical protein